MTATVVRTRQARAGRSAGWLAAWTAAVLAGTSAAPNVLAVSGSPPLAVLVLVATAAAAAEVACVGSWRLNVTGMEYAAAWLVVAAADLFVVAQFAEHAGLRVLWSRNVGPFALVAGAVAVACAVVARLNLPTQRRHWWELGR